MKKELINAYKTLLEHSWEIVQKQRHPLDLPKITKRYNKTLKDFEEKPEGFVMDTVEDIKSTYNWL